MHSFHKLIKELPDDFLLILRTINLIAIRNAGLGGTTRDRILLMTKLAYEIEYPNILLRTYYLSVWYLKLFIFEKLNFLYRKMFYQDPLII